MGYPIIVMVIVLQILTFKPFQFDLSPGHGYPGIVVVWRPLANRAYSNRTGRSAGRENIMVE